jgi:hypothetical protein
MVEAVAHDVPSTPLLMKRVDIFSPRIWKQDDQQSSFVVGQADSRIRSREIQYWRLRIQCPRTTTRRNHLRSPLPQRQRRSRQRLTLPLKTGTNQDRTTFETTILLVLCVSLRHCPSVQKDQTSVVRVPGSNCHSIE